MTWHLAGEPAGGQAVRTTDSQLSPEQAEADGDARWCRSLPTITTRCEESERKPNTH